MTPEIDTMREFVKNMYPGDRWRRRVRRMDDSQVMAIYIKEQAKVTAAELRKKKKSSDEISF